MLKEFRDFIMRGNIIEFAVGVIMAGAFGLLVNTFVNEVVLPPIGLLLGGVNFSELIINLNGTATSLTAAKEAGNAYIGWGIFVQNVINFLIISAVMFAVLKAYNTASKKKEAAPAAPAADVVLLGEIRDLLKKQNR